ncbi:MAG: hypothetical protein M3Y80_05710 [Verrucomicrobiota bacterium]|nr:hypothetical protein [Verrucomicrobiota bacterium]
MDSPEQNQNGAIEQTQNVDRIRDIIFGSQMRDYDGRFQRLEERLVHDAASMRGDVQQRLEALEAFMKGEVESMTNRLRSEHTERDQALGKLAQDLAETARGLDLKINHLDQQAAKDIRDLREKLLEQSKKLGEEIRDKHEQMKSGLEQEAQQIRGAMTGRAALADMLSELSLRLKDEFKVPGTN